MKFIDYELECLAFDLIMKLTRAQEKRNKILLKYGKNAPNEKQEELHKLNEEISAALEKLKEIYDFH